jgi:hypothetical protein
MEKNMPNCEIILTNDSDFNAGCSIEAGKNKGPFHFDHHGPFKHEEPVCMRKIKPLSFLCEHRNAGCEFSQNGTDCLGCKIRIQITHLCADTYVALLKLLNPDAIEAFPDNQYQNFIKDIARLDKGKQLPADNQARLYWFGLKTFFKDVPRCTEEHQNVTDLINLDLPVDEVIEAGREVAKKNKEAYKKSFRFSQEHFQNTGLTTTLFFVADEYTEFFDPLFPYYGTKEENSVIIIFREKYKSISIGIDPRFGLTLKTFKNLGKDERKKCETCVKKPTWQKDIDPNTIFEGMPKSYEYIYASFKDVLERGCKIDLKTEYCSVYEHKDNASYQTTIAGIQFFGHDTVAGTERRKEGWIFEDAQKIATELYDKL